MTTFLRPTVSTAQQDSYKSIRQYLVFMAYLAGVKLLLTFLPHMFRSPSQAAVFEWKFVGLWTLAGLVGVALSARTGFPTVWDRAISRRRRVALPVLLGVGFGVLAIATDALTSWTRIVAKQMDLTSIHIEWPASLLIYPGGAIIVEVVYRLLPIPLVLWLTSSLLWRGRGQTAAFWTLAALTSLIEPWGDLDMWKYGAMTATTIFAQDYALNFAQAWLFRKNGFGVSVLMRIVFYMIWHVGYGLLGG